MVPSHRLLFPVDLSNHPFAMPPAVGEFINRPNVEVTLLHVIDAGTLRASQFARRMQMLDVLRQTHFSHCAVRRRLESGSPAIRILDYIHENEIEMLIMRARDSGDLDNGPLGRVAMRILREAPCPVWLEWQAGEQQNTVAADGARICCAIDGARSSEQVLRDAVVIAERLHCELTIISSVQSRQNNPYNRFHEPLMGQAEVLRETERIDRLRRRIAPNADVMVAAGWREEVIGRAVKECRARLLITGDCTQAVLAAEPTCPVLRLAHHPDGAISRRSGNLAEYRRVA